jgi:hypothetical protein
MMLPNSILVAYIWLLLRIKAFNNRGKGLTFHDLFHADFKTDAGGLLLFALLVLLLTALLQPFQIPLVRLVEGYWGRNRLGALAYRIGVAIHRCRRERLWRKADPDHAAPTDGARPGARCQGDHPQPRPG